VRKDMLTKMLGLLDPVVSVIAAIIALIAYVYTTFATIKYVDAKHDEAVKLLLEIKDTTKTIEARLWEIQREMGKKTE
jgi:hypothetical protein